MLIGIFDFDDIGTVMSYSLREMSVFNLLGNLTISRTFIYFKHI